MVVDAEASGAVQLGFRYEYANHFKSGIRYQNKKWSLIKEFKAQASIGFFLTAAAKIYGVAGPELGIGPRLGAEAGLIFSPDGIDWNVEVLLTLQAWAGAKVEILGYELDG